MLEKFNEEIDVQREKLATKARLEGVLNRLDAQKIDLEDKVCELDKIRIKEDKDVARLEKNSLSALLFSMIGKKEERLDKEKREAYAATFKYNEAKNELDIINAEIFSAENEFNKVKDADDFYKQAVDSKIEFMKISGSDEGKLIEKYENKMLEHEKIIKECNEVLSACDMAMDCASRAQEYLDKADGWSSWDILGGGVYADYVKHSNIDEAARFMSRLQGELERLEGEMMDINMPLDIDVNVKVSGGLKMADFFFDGFFADLAVKGHIEDSLEKISKVQKIIMDVAANVEFKVNNEIKQRDICQKKINEIVL